MEWIKRKHENKHKTNEYRCFIESNFVDGSGKRVNGKKYCLRKGSTKSDNVNVNGKNFYSRPIDSDIKQYEEITKLTTKQGEDYTTGCLLNYDYITKKV